MMRDQIMNMKVGDVLDFPAEKVASVRSMASNVGTIMGRKYRTWKNFNDPRVYSVTREA